MLWQINMLSGLGLLSIWSDRGGFTLWGLGATAPTCFSYFFSSTLYIWCPTHYPWEFSLVEFLALDSQFENYFTDVCSDNAFSELEGISDISLKFVETRKHVVYPLVYLLLELARFDTTGGNCNSWKSIFCYKYHQELDV